MDNKYYLYRHIRLDKNEPFYIGIGTKRNRNHYRHNTEYERAFSKSSRSVLWQNVVSKTEYQVEILFESDNYDFIKEKEVEFIFLYVRRDCCGGSLVNLTDGGEGTKGIVYSEEYKNNHSKIFSGENHPNWGKTLSEETKRRKSESMKKSDKSLKGKKLPEWWCKKISGAVKGENNVMYGRTGAKHPNSKKIEDINTKEVYESITEAAKSTIYSMKYVASMIKGDKPNKTNLRYYNGV